MADTSRDVIHAKSSTVKPADQQNKNKLSNYSIMMAWVINLGKTLTAKYHKQDFYNITMISEYLKNLSVASQAGYSLYFSNQSKPSTLLRMRSL